MSTRIGKWGGSLSVRLPKNIVDLLAIRAGDYVRVRLGDDDTIYIKLAKAATVQSPSATLQQAPGDAQDREVKW